MKRDQITLVTGAAGALGSTLVRYLAERAHRVIAVDRPQAEAALRTLAASIPNCVALPLAGDASNWKSALQQLVDDGARPNGAVLVAGAWQGGAPFHESSDSVWDAMFSANLDSAALAIRSLLPHMLVAGQGSIVAIGSRAAVRPWESAGAAAYASSKAALVALVKAVSAEVLAQGVRLNAILPSTLDTQANRAAMPDADASHWVSTESLAGIVEFLLSVAARDISGAEVPVYGRVGV